VTGTAKRKGDRAELEAADLIRDQLGYPARRRLGAGRADDQGDLDGIPNHVVQVAAWDDVLSAVRIKPLAAERQRVNAGEPFAATLIKFPRAGWRVVLTVEQWAALVREANAGTEPDPGPT
jgi:hypothetical protein